MAGSFKESYTRWLSSDRNELSDRIKLLLQEKQAGDNSDILNEEIFALVHKLLDYKCPSTEQHTFLLFKCLN